MPQKMRYRLALDLGSTSLGWAMIRLDASSEPCAIVKAGVRIFSDGRNPKDGSSLAVTRREARSMRRRRDRLLKRKARMMQTLLTHGFFPKDDTARRALELLSPYALRAKGLDEALKPEEFARALFHINQRRGFKSNRKTDKKDNDSGALKTAINRVRENLTTENCRTVGEWLNKRFTDETVPPAKRTVRARYRQQRVEKEDGKTRIDKSYDLYIDRAMIEAEFDALWAKQASLNAALFNDTARAELKDCLLHQRPLKPVKPGRCTLLPDLERAPLALPSTQRFRIYQEVNNLRILRDGLKEEPLTLQQRNDVVNALEVNSKRSFTQIKKILGLGGAVTFNLEDAKRQELKGNATSAAMSRKECFGDAWFELSETKQDEIVMQLVKEENEAKLVNWLVDNAGVDEQRSDKIANTGLPEGYGSLSAEALNRILPELRREVITYDKAVIAAEFDHHSNISPAATGEILPALPYYGEPLQRFVGFGTGVLTDTAEKRFGKIANPTVHIGLNQVRLVVNALIKRYGHPSEVIVEVARELKQSQDQRDEATKRQADNQKRNTRIRTDIAGVLHMSEERVKHSDIQKWILWEELSFDPADRHCPYSGVQISAEMLLSPTGGVEIEHILPFARTLDDSLNNKTVSMRQANRIKGNDTPWEAFGKKTVAGFSFEAILKRAEQMPKAKRYRFGEDGYEKWLKDDKGFLARALNDTRYLSKVAREYVSLICPQNTRVIPGQMTAMLRAKFALNDVLGLNGEKNRNDHRHHAVDACVIAVTDQGLLQRFAQASASARERQLDRLVENMPLPWETYREHVQRAIDNIWVSHKPDHSHEAGFADDTAYRPPHLDPQGRWRTRGIGGVKPNDRDADAGLIAISAPDNFRHARDVHGHPLPYKGYVGGANYAMEITQEQNGKWIGSVVTTFDAYKIVRVGGIAKLRHVTNGQDGKPLLMRIAAADGIALEIEGVRTVFRAVKMRSGRNQLTLVGVNEANHANRMKEKDSSLLQLQDQSASSLQRMRARRINVSPIGELRDPGFKE